MISSIIDRPLNVLKVCEIRAVDVVQSFESIIASSDGNQLGDLAPLVKDSKNFFY